MAKSATDVMQEIIFSAVVDAVTALKGASKGLPNNLVRDVNAIHPNVTFADLPKEVRAAIGESVRAAFNRLLKEGYSVAHREAPPPRAPAQRTTPPPAGSNRRPPSGDRRPPSGDRRPPSGDRRPGGRPGGRPGDGRKPPRKPG